MTNMIYASFQEEQLLWSQGFQFVCGVDEVGRGCFAGPIVTAAVIFPPNINFPSTLSDSKLLTPQKRQKLAEEIKKYALAWSINQTRVDVINEIGIGQAAQQSFKKSVISLSQQPDFILIDAFYIQDLPKQIQKPIIKGDQISSSIAAASIIAKVYRDQLMVELAKSYPEYGFDQHKGYGTKAHREAIKNYGLSDQHRTSFDLIKFL